MQNYRLEIDLKRASHPIVFLSAKAAGLAAHSKLTELLSQDKVPARIPMPSRTLILKALAAKGITTVDIHDVCNGKVELLGADGKPYEQ